MTGPAAPSWVDQLLDACLGHEPDSSWFRRPEIPEKKLRNAISKYAQGVKPEDVLALGDGTVFGSAKEGILLTADTLYLGTSEGISAVPLDGLVCAKKLGGWPVYGVELTCRDGSSHQLSMSCFERKQDSFVDFINTLGDGGTANVVQPPTVATAKPTSIPMRATPVGPTTTAEINTSLKHMQVCEHAPADDVGALFELARTSEAELPLLKGYCQYIGFNGREVDGIVVLTNHRLLLFSMESGAKIVFVEMANRLLGHLPLFGSLIGLLLFTAPRAVYEALNGGKDKLISTALEIENAQLLSKQPPLRKVQEIELTRLAQSISSAMLGMGVWTGILDRKFGLSFDPATLSKAFSIPKDLILAKCESLEPFAQLLQAIRPTLARCELDYQLDSKGQKLTLLRTACQSKAAA